MMTTALLILLSLLLLRDVSGLQLSALQAPSNFWLLRRHGVISTDEDLLVAEYISSLRAGDETAAQQTLDMLLTRPIAVEFEQEANKIVDLGDGVMAEELGATQRAFVLPGGDDNRTVARIEEIDSGDGGLGARVWDAAVGLSIWLHSSPEDIVRGRTCLELGSGIGLGGVSASLAGASSVTLSDVAVDDAVEDAERKEHGEFGGEALLTGLASNAALNGVDATTLALDWSVCLDDGFSPSRRYEVVLGADLVHTEKYDLEALCAAVVKHTAPDGAAYLMSTVTRPGVSELPDALRRWGGDGSAVVVEEMAVMNSFGQCEVVLVTYRPPSSA